METQYRSTPYQQEDHINIGSVAILARDNLNKIVEIGDLPQDSDEIKTEHHFMIYMGLLMSIGGFSGVPYAFFMVCIFLRSSPIVTPF